MVLRQTRKHFGEAFGPHRFRHDAGTVAPISNPKRPGAVAAILGNSTAVLQKAYNLGRQQEAARRFRIASSRSDGGWRGLRCALSGGEDLSRPGRCNRPAPA
jgi:hypothetical protein